MPITSFTPVINNGWLANYSYSSQSYTYDTLVATTAYYAQQQAAQSAEDVPMPSLQREHEIHMDAIRREIARRAEQHEQTDWTFLNGIRPRRMEEENIVRPTYYSEEGESINTYTKRRIEDENRLHRGVKPINTWGRFRYYVKDLRYKCSGVRTFERLEGMAVNIAMHKYKEAWDTAVAAEYARDKLITLINKITGWTFGKDDYNKWGLTHPEFNFKVKSLAGDLKVNEKTFKNVAARCSLTNDHWLIAELLRTSRGMISPTQYDMRGYWHCESCDTHREFHEDTCRECSSRKEPMEVGKIYNYTANVRSYIPHLFDTRKKRAVGSRNVSPINNRNKPKLYFGLELEVIPRAGVDPKDAAYWVSSAMAEHAIMKSDASLTAGGFEIVTAPCTLDYHRDKVWNKLFNLTLPSGKKAADLVKSWATNCCGLHIHFTRAALTAMQSSKVLVFFHEPTNHRFLSDIAGRRVSPDAPYCKQSKKKLYGKKANGLSRGRTTADDCTHHREAIVVSERNGGKTVEVRIFKGNVTKHGIMRCLEFVAAIIEWCGVNGARELKYTNFLEWFDEPSNRRNYPDLWKFLLSLRYLGTSHKSLNKKILDELPKEIQAA